MADLQIPNSRPVSLPSGSSVTICGTPNNAFRKEPQMQVDFHSGKDEKSNIAFSFRVYFGKSVVMNSLLDDGWGDEVVSYEMPFAEGKPFELSISAFANKYQVSVNGKHYFSFAHRVPLSSVQMIQVWRDIFLTSIKVQEGQ